MNHKLYSYTDPLGRRKFIYANDLTELREKKQKLQRDQLDGLDLYAQGKATINDTFDRYISTKYELRDSTKDFQDNQSSMLRTRDATLDGTCWKRMSGLADGEDDGNS